MVLQKIVAPFNEVQVERLNDYQERGEYHFFTCPSEHGEGWPTEERVLVATTDGWVCKECSYTQNWAHAFMAMPIKSP